MATQPQPVPAAGQSAALLPGFGLFAVAHAQERVEDPPAEPAAGAATGEQPAPAGDRKMIIETTADQPCPLGTLRFYAGLQEIGTIPLSSCGEEIEPPAQATHFGISTRDANPNRFELRDAELATYEFQYEYNFWTDVRAGLGNRELRAYDLLLSRVIVPDGPDGEPLPETGPGRPGS